MSDYEYLDKALELICDDLFNKRFWLPFVPNTIKEIKDYYIKLAKGE